MGFKCVYANNGETYYLHRRLNLCKNAYLYYFTREEKDSIDLPANLEVIEGHDNGFPLVRKKSLYER